MGGDQLVTADHAPRTIQIQSQMFILISKKSGLDVFQSGAGRPWGAVFISSPTSYVFTGTPF